MMTPAGRDEPMTDVEALAQELATLAVDHQLHRSVMESTLIARRFPARLYRPLLTMLAESGTILIDDEVKAAQVAEPDPGPVDDRHRDSGFGPGWNEGGFEYFVRSHWHDVLTPEQEHALAVRVRRGRLAREGLEAFGDDLDFAERRRLNRAVADGTDAETELLHANLRLVLKEVKRHRKEVGPALGEEDLFQEGVIGLGHALTKFDPERGLKVSTYATWWIRQRINRAIADKRRVVRLPVHKYEQVRRVVATAAAMANEGRPASADQVAARLGLSAAVVGDCMALSQPARSLDYLLGDGGDTLGAVLADLGSDPAEVATARVAGAELVRAFDCLNERERQILNLRFGLEDGQERTLEEVGREFGVTRERIRQIESKALNKLRGNKDVRAMRRVGPKENAPRRHAMSAAAVAAASAPSTSLRAEGS